MIYKTISHKFSVENHHNIGTRNVGDKCSYKTNPKCFISTEFSYKSSCCTPNEPCGIEQGGCEFDDDCFDNLECVRNSCGLNSDATMCCQAPGKKPGLLNQEYLALKQCI